MELLVQVGERLTTSGDQVKETVINTLVEIEINRRVELVTKVIKTIDNFEKDLKKLSNPDDVRYQSDGITKIECFTKERIDNRTKTTEKLEKLTNKLNQALNTNTEQSFKELQETHDKFSSNSSGSKS